jgi:dimethylhistidine N-methyltransferase
MSVVARAPEIEDDVLVGLRARPKRLPTRLLYDEIGTSLFQQITGVDDYYPARNELRLLDAHLPEISVAIGIAARVIEPGSGSGIKTKRLLRALDRPASYIAVDLVVDALAYTASMLRAEHPELEIHPIVADYTQLFDLPSPRRPLGKTLVFFPGSAIGNFEPHEAVTFLSRMLRIAGPNARLLLSVDGTHDRDALLHAYNDLDGVTAEFNKNVLVHLNRSRGATFDLDAFDHRAAWNADHARVEMRLVARADQHVLVGNETFKFAAGESLITEHCYKHSIEAMRGILGAAGWAPVTVYTAQEQPIRLWLCAPREAG